MKNRFRFALAIFAAAAVSMASCSKDDEKETETDTPENNGEETSSVTVTPPSIDSSCVDMYCYDNYYGKNVISWTAPIVTDASTNKTIEYDYTYQFMISDDNGNTWKSFERQTDKEVSIKKDVEWEYDEFQFPKYISSNFSHSPLPDSDNISLQYLDSLNADVQYLYKVVAYYTDEDGIERSSSSQVFDFVVQVSDFSKFVSFTSDGNTLTISWTFPCSNTANIEVSVGNETYDSYYYYCMIAGSIEGDKYLWNNYFMNNLQDQKSCTFNKPEEGYDLDEFTIIFVGNESSLSSTVKFTWNE